MKVLVSEKLSEHKYKTPEGYLICTDAILARTGKQSYTKDELFQDGDNTEVNVDRPYDEVMNAKTIASFENKPITFDHPDEDVNVGNYKDYAIGYVRDVRQGKTDKGEDVILGNLVITDQDAINAIEQGDHTDLSCGYDCDIRDDGNGNYSQTNIRGNHLALCEQGRAGIAHIVDSKVKDDSWFKGYINGDLQSYNIDSLINNVKSKKQPLHTNLTGKSGNVYTIFIDGSLESNVDKGSNMWIDIVVEKPDGQQKRLLSEKFNSWNECQKIFNAFKNKVRDSKIVDSKVEDENLLGKRVRIRKRYSNLDGTIGTIFSYEGTNYDDEVEVKSNDHIYKVDYEDIEFLDSKVEDVVGTSKAYEMYLQRLERFKNDKEALEYDLKDLMKTKVLPKDEVEDLISKYKHRISNLQDSINDSKEMTMSDVIKMLNIVDIYKKVRDASKNEWVIKNTGLAYEIWNQGKIVKKFPTKKLAIEWIHSRFPTDEITEDSTKDGRLWSALTRKAKN